MSRVLAIPVRLLDALGAAVIWRFARWAHLSGLAVAVVRMSVWPGNWGGPVREVFARQVLFTGVEAVRFVAIVAFWIGIAVVLQVQIWLDTLGQSKYLGPILSAVVIREIGPLLVNLIVIGRSGNATAAELANMTINGEVRALEAQGIDPMGYLVLPRVAAWIVSVSCLMVWFVAMALATGYLFGFAIGVRTGSPMAFADNLARAVSLADVLNVMAKCVFPPMLGAIIACEQGLRVERSPIQVPQATSRTMQSAVVMLFSVSGLISAATYL